jgi:hypothetical protein
LGSNSTGTLLLLTSGRRPGHEDLVRLHRTVMSAVVGAIRR